MTLEGPSNVQRPVPVAHIVEQPYVIETGQIIRETSITITDDIMKYAYKFSEVIICGGGTKNTTLIKIIKQILTNFKITTTSDYGLSPDCIEAVTFAWLAKKRLENQTSNIPTVTGATERVILGGIYSPIKKNS